MQEVRHVLDCRYSRILKFPLKMRNVKKSPLEASEYSESYVRKQ